MKKLGIVYSSYATPEYNKDSLSPFLNRDNVSIAACSFRFSGFNTENNTPNINSLLPIVYGNKNVTLLYDKSEVLTEHDARNRGLEHLLSNNCDVIMIVDSDEMYTNEQVDFIEAVINSPDFSSHAWYSINFKNYVFDNKQWVDGFCPPRLFNVDFADLKLKEFYWDNDACYQSSNVYVERKVDYKALPHAEIDKDKLHVRHLTWVGERAVKKVRYQMQHFGNCSFKVTEDGKGVEFNPRYYEKTGEKIPTVYTDP